VEAHGLGLGALGHGAAGGHQRLRQRVDGDALRRGAPAWLQQAVGMVASARLPLCAMAPPTSQARSAGQERQRRHRRTQSHHRQPQARTFLRATWSSAVMNCAKPILRSPLTLTCGAYRGQPLRQLLQPPAQEAGSGGWLRRLAQQAGSAGWLRLLQHLRIRTERACD
jgi:hypothetical protein